MIRFATLYLLAICSASAAAETADSQVERDDQRLEFSKMMRGVPNPEIEHYANSGSGIPTLYVGRKKSLASFGWYSHLTLKTYEDIGYSEDSQVFERTLSPALSLNLSGSSLSFFRRGLRFEADNSPWFFNLNFRNVNRGSKLIMREDPRVAKGKALVLDFGVSF